MSLPAGFTGNPEAAPRCSLAQFHSGRCSRLSFIGYHVMDYRPGADRTVNPFGSPVYNIEPPDGTVARFAFRVATVTIVLDMRIRSDGRYDLVTDLTDISQALVLHASRLGLFGVPADLQGDGPRRGPSGMISWGGSSGAPRTALLTLGATWGPPQPATIRVRPWQRPDVWTADAYTGPANTGCDAQRFAGTVDLRPDRPRAGVPAAFEATVRIPQSDNAGALGSPPLRCAVVTLPEGVAVSPSNASGLVGCSDAQAALGSEQAPACPAASRIGAVQIETPVLPEPLTGAVFLGRPLSMDAARGDMLRVFLVAQARA